ncbi:MAG: hypothetical protein ABIK95_06115 [Acidobacteriota bacterium]
MREWKLVFSLNKQKKGPGSEEQDYLGIRDIATRITHAIFSNEAKTVCGALYDNEEFPDKTAGFYPNCGNCYKVLVRMAKWEKKRGEA